MLQTFTAWQAVRAHLMDRAESVERTRLVQGAVAEGIFCLCGRLWTDPEKKIHVCATVVSEIMFPNLSQRFVIKT